MRDANEVVEELLAKCRADHAAWINGDASGYAIPEDGTLMGALGGTTHGGAVTVERQQSAASLWESGAGEVELVDGGVHGEIAWLTMIARARVKFAGRDEPERWDLRVTELFRHTPDGWERFHRHADPIVGRLSLDDARRLLP